MKRVESIRVDGKRSCDRPKKLWKEQVRNDISKLHLYVDLIRDKTS